MAWLMGIAEDSACGLASRKEKQSKEELGREITSDPPASSDQVPSPNSKSAVNPHNSITFQQLHFRVPEALGDIKKGAITLAELIAELS